MKIMVMDSSLPEWNTVPLHPETGQPWIERYQDLVNLSAMMKRYAFGLDYEATKAKRDKLISDTEFRNEFYIVELVPTTEPEPGVIKYPVYSCHPETWARFPDEVKATFKLIEQPMKQVGDKIHIPGLPDGRN